MPAHTKDTHPKIDPALSSLRGPGYVGEPNWLAISLFQDESRIGPREWSFRQFLFALDYFGRLVANPVASAGFQSEGEKSPNHYWLAQHQADIWAYDILFRAISYMQGLILETRRLHDRTRTSPVAHLDEDIPEHAFPAYAKEILTILDSNVETDHKFAVLQAISETLTDFACFEKLNLLLDHADRISPDHASMAVMTFASSLVNTWASCPPLTSVGQDKIGRLIRLAESVDPIANISLKTASGNVRILEPSRVVYTQTATVLRYYLSLTPRVSSQVLADYDRECLKFRDLFFAPAHTPSKLDLQYMHNFCPGQAGLGWPSSIPDLQNLLRFSLNQHGSVITQPPEQYKGSVVEMQLPLGSPRGAETPQIFIRVPGDDMMPFLLGMEWYPYSSAYLANPLTVWANDPSFFVQSAYGRLAKNLPSGKDAQRRTMAAAEIHDSLIATVVGMAFGSFSVPLLMDPAMRMVTSFLGRLIGRRSWSYFSQMGSADDESD